MLGDQIRKARLTRGLTQEELAFRAKISRNYVSLLEKGVKSPTVNVLMRVAKAIGAKASVWIAVLEKAKL